MGHTLASARAQQSLSALFRTADPITFWKRELRKLFERRQYWFEWRDAAHSAEGLARATKEIGRCEELIMKIETVHLTPLFALQDGNVGAFTVEVAPRVAAADA